MLTQACHAQQKHIKGQVVDKASGEKVINAMILTENGYSLTTNDNGEFILFYENDSIKISVSHISFYPLDTSLSVSSLSVLTLIMLPRDYALQDVTIGTIRRMERENSSIISQRLDLKQLNNIPGLLGEKDIVKGLLLLPGVTMGSEGSSSFYVRGGSPDQNLILIDGVPVYNISHMFGLFSVFIPETVQELELIKGGFPARYGGRLSSVCNIKMREGNRNDYKYDLSIGSISSKIVAEGPLIKEKTSFILSARRTYFDLFLRPLQSMNQDPYHRQNAGGYFHDLVIKANHSFNQRNNLFVSFYTGKDVFKVRTEDRFPSINSTTKGSFGLNWGNYTWIVRLFSSLNSSTYSNISVSQSNYNYGIGSVFSVHTPKDPPIYSKNKYSSGIVDWALRWDLNHQLNNHLSIRGGVHSILHRFSPGNILQEFKDTSVTIRSTEGSAFLAPEVTAYSEIIFSKNKLNLNLGLRCTGYFPENASYPFIEPRLALAYRINPWLALRSGYSVMNQSILLLSSNGIGLPVDLWVPATRNVKPQKGVQYDLGFSIYPPNIQAVNISMAGYYKYMENVLEIFGGMSLMQTANEWETAVLQGSGESYGMEVLIEKPTGKISGWLAYTLSWNNRFFEKLNQGKPFPHKYDNRHVVNISGTYQFNQNIGISAAWSLQSGSAFSLPVGQYYGNPEFFPDGFYDQFIADDVPFPEYLEYYPCRNNARFPAYHRLDIAASFSKEKSKGTRVWEIGIYNAYSRKNPYYLHWGAKDNKKVLKQFTLLPFLPSATYRYKW